MPRFITHNGKKFMVGDKVTAEQLNGRVGEIIGFDKSGKDNEFNFAKVVTTFGGLSSVRVTNLKKAKLDPNLPRLKKHPSFIDNEGVPQLPFGEQSKKIIAENVEKQKDEQIELNKKFLGKTVKFDTSIGFDKSKRVKGKVVEVEKTKVGIFGTERTVVEVKDGKNSFFVEIKDLK